MNCDFSLTHYRKILSTAKDSGYRFGTYQEAELADDNFCILRHDMDYTPERSLEFANIENDLDIKAYYFFLVTSEIYNLRENRIYRVINELHKMGHHVGLHFDLTWNPNIQWKDVPVQCAEEKALFETLTGVKPCDIISFHNPHKFTELILNKQVDGMEHAYEKRYFSDIKYLSDSQGWYEGCVCKVFESKKYPKIQFLTHPYIWVDNPQANFTDDMAAMIQDKTQFLTEYMIKYHPVCEKNKDQLRNLTGFKTSMS